LVGSEPSSGYLLRSATAPLPPDARCEKSGRFLVYAPSLLAVFNEELPAGGNLDGLWAGRGWSGQVSGGGGYARAGFRLVIAPRLRYAQNRSFEVAPPPFFIPPVPSDISPYASAWNISPLIAGGRYSIDTPLRFGNTTFREWDPGESGLFFVRERWSLGITSGQMWWGPGIRNALLMSNNAPGVPRAELRTVRPLRTRAGQFDGVWFAGSLSESPFYNTHPEDDNQWLVGLGLTWSPPGNPNVEIGAARMVYGPSDEPIEPFRPFEVFANVPQPPYFAYADTNYKRTKDQLLSLFLRLRIPEDSFSFHLELGRAAQPENLRDLLVEPTHSLAYTVGVEYARGISIAPGVLRLQLELTSAEQSSTYLHRPTPSWYTSPAIRQGYTNRGRVIGAQLGPGSSGQFVALEYFGSDWRAGLIGVRSRWNTDAIMNLPFFEGAGFCEHDVTWSPGIRAARSIRGAGIVQLSASLSRRYNAFFNNSSGCPDGRVRRDVSNPSLMLSFSSLGGH
jgi:hypothetical protein